MKKPRKINTIKALKREIEYYKRQTFPVKFIEHTPLNHLKLQTMFTPNEVIMMPKDVIPNLLINRMAKVFADNIASLPIITSYDKQLDMYRAEIDLWVKGVNYEER